MIAIVSMSMSMSIASAAPADDERIAAARALHEARTRAENAWSGLANGDRGSLAAAQEAGRALLPAADRFERASDALGAALLGPGVPPAAADRHAAYLDAHRARRRELARTLPGLEGADPVQAARDLEAILAEAAASPARESASSIRVRHVRRFPPRAVTAESRDLADVRLGPDPTPQDSAPPPEEIASFARSFSRGVTAERIARWLRGEIVVAAFHGEAAGAQGCMRDRGCSAFDAASLLAGLLRARGVPARLAYGTVEADGRVIAARLLGGGSTQEALDALHLGGVPAAIDAGDRLRFEHVWVRARVGSAWIDLDPSFDPAARPPASAGIVGGGVPTAGSDPAEILSRYLADPADRTPFGADLLPKPAATGPKKKTLAGAQKSRPAVSWRILARHGDLATIPAAYRTYVAIAAGGSADRPLADVRIPLADALSTGILFHSMPPSDLDRRIALALGNEANVPPHLVTATTVISAGGREIAALPPLPRGTTIQVVVTLIPPGGDPIDIATRTQAGAPSAITVVPFSPGPGWLAARWRRADANPTGSSGAARWCAATGAQFFADLLDETGRLAARAGGRRFLSPSLVVVAGAMYAPSGLARAPLFADAAGISMDVGRFDEVLLPSPGARPVEFEVAAGAALSAWEGRALRIASGLDAVSTVTAAKSAAAAGGKPRALRGKAAAADLAAFSPDAREDITDALARGMSVVLPRPPQQLGGWIGESYVVLDPRSGRGAYLIRGGLRGAITADRASGFIDALARGGDAGPLLSSWRRGRAARALLAREGWPAGAPAKRPTGVEKLLAAASVRESVPVFPAGPWPPMGGRAKRLELGEPIALSGVGTVLWLGRGSRILDRAVVVPKGTPGFDPKTRLWIGPTAMAIVPVDGEARLLPIPARY